MHRYYEGENSLRNKMLNEIKLQGTNLDVDQDWPLPLLIDGDAKCPEN